MEEIRFDYNELTKKDRTAYDLMTPNEKASFERTWCKYHQLRIEMDSKLIKSNHRAQLRANRDKEIKRKEDTHRKIVNGGILEAYLPDRLKQLDVDDKNRNTALHEFLDFAFKLPMVESRLRENNESEYYF